MRSFILVFSLISLSSCSTMSKSKLYGGIAGTLVGGLIGGVVGKQTSPNKQSEGVNGTIGMVIGAGAGAFGGYLLGKHFYEDDPENFKGDEIPLRRTPIQKAPENKSKQKMLPFGLKLSDLKINTETEVSRVYKVPTSNNVPKKYRSQVQKQVIIEHKIPDTNYELPNGGTLFFNQCSATETRFVRKK